MEFGLQNMKKDKIDLFKNIAQSACGLWAFLFNN
jgi:hypothetical protein